MKWRLCIILGLILVLNTQRVVLAQAESDALLLQINAKEEEIKKLEADLSKYKIALSKTQNQSNTLKNQIVLIEAKINKLNADLKITKVKISKTESNIKLYSIKIVVQEQKIQERQA